MRFLNPLLNAVLAVSLILLAFAAFGDLGAVSPQPAQQPDQPVTEAPQAAPASAPAPANAEPAPVTLSPWSASTGSDAHPAAGAPVQQAVNAPAPSPQVPAPAKPAVITKKSIAKDLFGAKKEPASLATRSIGFYSRGCLAGGKPLPVNGPAWQVMRLSRNRNWGHPTLIKFIERFAEDAKQKDGWPGLLIGDLSMPRGGPMPFGHASHQIGLDVDIWYKTEPDRVLSGEEREDIPMQSFLLDPGHVNPAMWKPDYEKLLRRAASYPEVARIFVNPAIKKWLCDNTTGDRSFLHKIQPIPGHDDHFHVRLVCPADNPGCENQKPLPSDEGCGKGLDKWIEALMKAAPRAAPQPKPGAKAVVSKRKPLTLGQLPNYCEKVLEAPPEKVTTVAR